jgi:hypothetical protein
VRGRFEGVDEAVGGISQHIQAYLDGVVQVQVRIQSRKIIEKETGE